MGRTSRRCNVLTLLRRASTLLVNRVSRLQAREITPRSDGSQQAAATHRHRSEVGLNALMPAWTGRSSWSDCLVVERRSDPGARDRRALNRGRCGSVRTVSCASSPKILRKFAENSEGSRLTTLAGRVHWDEESGLRNDHEPDHVEIQRGRRRHVRTTTLGSSAMSAGSPPGRTLLPWSMRLIVAEQVADTGSALCLRAGVRRSFKNRAFSSSC